MKKRVLVMSVLILAAFVLIFFSGNFSDKLTGRVTGWEYEGYCWFNGEVGQSCDDVCADYGGAEPLPWPESFRCDVTKNWYPDCSCTASSMYNALYKPSEQKCLWDTNTYSTDLGFYNLIRQCACQSCEEVPEEQCDATHLNLCTDETSCTGASGHWYDSTCNAEAQEVCDSSHLSLCVETNCTGASGYWYNGVCNAQAQATQDACDSTHLTLCVEANCTSAGGYWYSSTCNSQAQQQNQTNTDGATDSTTASANTGKDSSSDSGTDSQTDTATKTPAVTKMNEEDWGKTETVSQEEQNEFEQKGITKQVGLEERIEIEIEGEEHHVGILDISADGVITIQIESNPQLATLKKGDERKFDTNDDGFYDLLVKFNKIVDGKADITTKAISEEITGKTIEEEQEKETQAQEDREREGISETTIWTFLLIGVIVIIMVVGIIMYLVYRKTNEENMASNV